MSSLSIGPRLTLTQTQKLTLTPQLRQAIELLTLNHMQLLEKVQEEMVENPVLEVIPDTESHEPTRAEEALKEKGAQEVADQVDQKNGADSQDIDWEKLLEGLTSSAFKRGTGGSRFDDLPPIEATLAASNTLVEHLLAQFKLESCTGGESRAGVVIMLNLDDKGYLPMTLEEVAEEAGVHIDDAEGAQMIVQSLEPLGCGSLDMVECLLVQSKELYPEDPFIGEIIRNHIDDFESRNYQRVAREMDMDVEDAIEYHKMLQEEFEPWPGRGYSDAEPQYITPDVKVYKVGGEWQIELNEDGLPKLRVSPYYQKILMAAGEKADKTFIKEKLKSAKFLIESIYRRQSTIYKVVEQILKRQRDFFDYGPAHLRPMVLRDIAVEVEVHESTVSRVTSKKYLECPQGIFELKYFFSSGVQQSSGEDISAVAIKTRIKVFIDAEDPRKPLSDSALAKLLKAEGMACARRTVAKYREAMGLLSSSKRKCMF